MRSLQLAACLHIGATATVLGGARERRRLLSTVWYVDADAADGGIGGSWGDAFNDLQGALSAARASDGTDEVWVAEGTYKPTSGTDRTISFELDDGIDLYGGFAETETTLSERDWVTNVTILCGDLEGDDDAPGGDTTDNSYHVVRAGFDDFPSGVTDAKLDGFTVTSGNADGYGPTAKGGGMYNYNSSPTLTNVAFIGQHPPARRVVNGAPKVRGVADEGDVRERR